MLTGTDLVNIFLPQLSHWMIWLIFLVVVSVVIFVYAYPIIKKTRKGFKGTYIYIPVIDIIALYIFTKLLEGVVYSGSILKVDAWVGQIIFTLYIPWIINVAQIITTFGSTLMISFLFVIAMAALLLRKRWRYAVISTVAILGSVALQLSFKALTHRARPENLLETGYSFPSGHAITAIVFVSLLIYSFRDDFKNKKIRYVLIALASSFFLLVAISRIILHVHWFSDVLAGISLGVFWFVFLVLVERAITGLIPAVRRETKAAEPIIPTIAPAITPATKTKKKKS